jgi:transcriptional regulator with XRE-family HTH domain
MGGTEVEDVPALPFGALLKRYRRRAQLNQAALAKGAGYSDSHISMLERGERLATPTTVDLLAQALDLEAHERAALHAALRRARTGGWRAQEVDERAAVGEDVVIVPVRAGVCGYCHERVIDDEATARIDAAIAAVRDGGATLERVGVVYRAAPAATQEKRPDPS